MTNKKKRKIIKILYCVYLVFLICFIFSNSMVSKEESANTSTGVLAFVNNVMESIGIPFSFEHNFIRKAAHVIEFMALGVSLFGFIALDKKVNINNSVYCAFFSCLVAITDETIQYFYERGSMVVDVWLDFASAVLGMLIAQLIYYIVLLKKQKPRKF